MYICNKNKNAVRFLIATYLLLYPCIVKSQTIDDPPHNTDGKAEKTACDVNVFTSENFYVVDQTGSAADASAGVIPLLEGSAIASMLKVRNPDEIKKYMSVTLSKNEQNKILSGINMLNALNLKYCNLYFDTPFLTKSDKIKYFFNIGAVQYFKTTINKIIKSSFLFEIIDKDGSIIKIVQGDIDSGISNFPPSGPDNADLAAENLRKAYISNVAKFIRKKLR